MSELVDKNKVLKILGDLRSLLLSPKTRGKHRYAIEVINAIEAIRALPVEVPATAGGPAAGDEVAR